MKRETTRKHTDKTKKMMSEKRKQWLKDNPDKHVWKRKDKFISIPCEHFKERLRQQNINFVEEYSPLQTNSFSLDIAFPDKKIAIEINGEQHYNRDGSLKEYYQKRHDLIEQDGWKIIEFKSSMVYNNELSNKLIDDLKEEQIGIINYSFYIEEQKRIIEERKNKIKELKYKCKNCNTQIGETKSGLCNICVRKKSRNVNRPHKEQLQEEINTMSYEAIGRKYGVSGMAIKKWMKTYNIVANKEKNETLKPTCRLCGKTIKCDGHLCRNCYLETNGYIYEKEKPSKEVLKEQFKTMRTSEIARYYGRSRSAIRNWIDACVK